MELGVKYGMGTNALISTGVMFTVWEREEKTLVDILSEFALFCLSKYPIGPIDISLLCKNIHDEFGIELFPGVAESVVKRISKKRSDLIEKKNRKFVLNKNGIDISEFSSSRAKATERIEKITSALREYLVKNSIYYKSNTDIHEALTCFLNEYGYYYYENVRLAQAKNDGCRLNTAIGRFVVQEYENKSEIFNNLLEVFNGLMLARIMQYEVEHRDIRNQRYSDVIFYLDTPLLLALLGCLSDYENKSCLQLVNILQGLGASFAYFPEHFGELVSILNAYINSINNPPPNKWRTLEGLDQKKYTMVELVTFRDSMSVKLDFRGVVQKHRPTYEYYQTDPHKKRKFIDETELSLYITENIPSYKENHEGLDNDIKAIAAIAILRDGTYASQVEKCKAAFVVSNKALARHATYFLESQFGNSEVPLIIDDIYLSIHAWIKAGKKRSDFALLRVMADSMAAIRPKQGFREAVLSKIELLKSRGDFSDAEAQVAQANWMLLDDWQALTDGNPDALTSEDVKQAVDRFEMELRERLQKEKLAEMESIRQQGINQAEEVLKEICKDAKKKSNAIQKILKWIVCTLLVLPATISAILLISESSNFNVLIIISLVVSVAGILDFTILKLHNITKEINKFALTVEDRIRAKEFKKARKYNSIINEIANDNHSYDLEISNLGKNMHSITSIDAD